MKKYFLSISLSALYIFINTSCNTTTKPGITSEKVTATTAFNLDSAKKEIEAADQNFAVLLAKGDSAGLANCYTSDAKIMAPNKNAYTGRKNIQTAMSNDIDAGFTNFKIITVDVWGNEDVLASEDAWVFYDKKGNVMDSGKSIELWKKEDGKWKMFRDCYNSDIDIPKL